MFKRNCVILFVFLVVAFVFSPLSLAADEVAKKAILEELSKLADKNPDILRNIIFTIGDEYSRENEVDKTIALYEKALKVLPDNEDFLNRLGGLYNQKGDYDSAAEVYKKMTEINPQNVWYFNMLSDAYKNAGDKEKAASVWGALTKSSDNADVHMQAANFYSNQGDADKAIDAVKKAIKLNPENFEYQRNLESFYMNAEKFDEAENICNEILASDKDQWTKDWADSELINIYQRQDKLEELAVKFEKDLAKASDDISKYIKLSDLYQRSNQRDKAIEVGEKAVAAGVDNRDINNRLLDQYESSEKFDKAVSQLDKMIATNPEENYLYERRANLLARAGKQDEAKKAWKEYLKELPNEAGSYSRFGDKLNEWGDADAAIEQYRKAQSLDPSNLWYTMRVADILIAKGKLDEAKKELNGILKKASDDWMKEEAKRKISDIDGRPKEADMVTKEAALPPAIVEVVKEDIKTEEVKAEAKPKEKKKKGWFFGR